MPDDPFLERPDARQAYLLAWILVGCEEGASRVLVEALRETATHPGGGDPIRQGRLLVAATRRRALRTQASCSLTPTLADLRRRAEPGRSLVLLDELEILSGDEAAALLGLDPTVAHKAASQTREFFAAPNLLREEIGALAPNPTPECRATLLGFPGEASHERIKNPAVWAVAASFLLLIGVAAWQFTGRAGAFPDEALKIAEQARKAGPEKFSPVEIKVGALPDWFALQGFDGLFIPDAFSGLDVVGARLFRHEGEPVAQMAVQDGERNLYLIAFPAKPFDTRGLSAGTWGIATSGRFVVAATERNGVCLLVTFRGSRKEMETFLGDFGRRRL